MNPPGGNPKTINNLVPGVIAKLQNRTDITPQQASLWIQRSLQNITESQPFEELRISLETGAPLVLIGSGLAPNHSVPYAYPVSIFLKPTHDVTLMEDPVIFIDYPTNSISYPMDYMNPKAITPLLNVPGSVPFKYTRYGPNFWFGGNPNQNYQVYVPYQVRHPFNEANLPASTLYIPPTWEEIVEYDAARRGAIELRWPDMAQYLLQVIYGDPKNQGDPGLLKMLSMQMDRDQRNSSRQFSVRVQRY
jgi:hypothetical protein